MDSSSRSDRCLGLSSLFELHNEYHLVSSSTSKHFV
nr:MAG TPA: hypothetical protein [Caudoviricetes sp.]